MEKILLYLNGYIDQKSVIGLQFSFSFNKITIGGHKHLRGKIDNFIHTVISKKIKINGRLCSNQIYKVTIENFGLKDMQKLSAEIRRKRKYGYEFDYVQSLGLTFGIYPKGGASNRF